MADTLVNSKGTNNTNVSNTANPFSDNSSNGQITPPPVTPPTPPTTPNTGEQYEVDDGNPDDLDVTWARWRCLVCNYTYEGSTPLKKCPRCGNEDPDKFEDVD